MNNKIFMLCFTTLITGFLIDRENYTFINESNKYINNYKMDSPLNVLTREYKYRFFRKYMPLTINLSSGNLTSIFLMCADFISEEDLYKINKLFDSDNLLRKSLKTESRIEITNVIKPCRLNEHISIYNEKYQNLQPIELKQEKKEVTFSRIDVVLKINEIHFYVFNTDFIRDLDPSKFKEYKELVQNLKSFAKFQTPIIFAECQTESIKLTLPEFYILGIWSFLRENNETSSSGNLKKTSDCGC